MKYITPDSTTRNGYGYMYPAPVPRRHSAYAPTPSLAGRHGRSRRPAAALRAPRLATFVVSSGRAVGVARAVLAVGVRLVPFDSCFGSRRAPPVRVRRQGALDARQRLLDVLN